MIPDEAQRFFGEKIISGEYAKCLIVMEDEDKNVHTWNATTLSDMMGLVEWARLRAEQLWNELDGIDSEEEEDG